MAVGGQKVATLVFLDFESTGLPKFDFRPRAIELCLIAVEREHFEDNGDNPGAEPRVENKIRLAFYPKKTISNNCYQLTGLCNENLKFQQPVDKDFADLLLLFIRRLSPPVCLIAHNGNQFDFKLLNAEIRRVGQTLPDNLLCADSLSAFRQLVKAKSNLAHGSVPNPLPRQEDSQSQIFDHSDYEENEMSDVQPNVQPLILPTTSPYSPSSSSRNNGPDVCTPPRLGEYETPTPSTSLEDLELLEKDMDIFVEYVKSPEFLKLETELMTPKKSGSPKKNSSKCEKEKPERKPKHMGKENSRRQIDTASSSKKSLLTNKTCKARRRLNFDSNSKSEDDKINSLSKVEESSQPAGENSQSTENSHRNEISENDHRPDTSPLDRLRKSKVKVRFGLDNLHQSIIGHPFENHHSAESDTMALLNLCRACNAEFCQWVDENAKPVASIPPMW